MNDTAAGAQLNERVSTGSCMRASARISARVRPFDRLLDHEHFRPDLKPYVGKLLCEGCGLTA